MEKQNQRGCKRKRKSERFASLLQLSDDDAIFAVLLAALFSFQKQPQHSHSLILIKKCLRRIRLSLTPQTHSISILSLLPVLLKSDCAEILACSAEIIGAASLLSVEMNKQIASDAEIVKALISALASSNASVLKAVCNAVLDLSTTSVGRLALLESSAVESLMFLNLSIDGLLCTPLAREVIPILE